jgi:phosphate/sulfate permease
MTLWNLLIGIVFFISIIGASDSAKQAGAGIGAYTIAISVGFVIGACCASAMWYTGKAVSKRGTKPHSPAVQTWCIRGLYFSSLLWLSLSALLGRWLTSELLHLSR